MGTKAAVIKYLPTYKWFLIASIPYESGKDIADSSLLKFMLGAEIVFIIFTLIYFTFFRHILKPLNSVTSFSLHFPGNWMRVMQTYESRFHFRLKQKMKLVLW